MKKMHVDYGRCVNFINRGKREKRKIKKNILFSASALALAFLLYLILIFNT